MGEKTPLASFSLTHVHYDPTDPISLACAWLALLPQGLVIVYTALIWSTREIEIALMFAGQLACEGLNWGLKRYFKQARPEAIRHLGKGYGMPSSHAQFVGYFAASVTLFLLLRHSPSARVIMPPGHKSSMLINGGLDGEVEVDWDVRTEGTPPPTGEEQKVVSDAYRLQLHYPRLTHAFLSLTAIASALAIAVSRVYLSYHTPLQVIVGGLIGVLFACVWFAATELARRQGWVEWLLELNIVRKARVRDLICEEDLVEIGWQLWEEKRRRRALIRRKEFLSDRKQK